MTVKLFSIFIATTVTTINTDVYKELQKHPLKKVIGKFYKMFGDYNLGLL